MKIFQWRIFSDTIREHLFSGGSGKAGLDLPALNIQRSRDHGIPGKENERDYEDI